MPKDNFFDVPFSVSECFHNTPSVCQGITPWQTENSLAGFEISSVSSPVIPWQGEIQIPDFFYSEGQKPSPRLTNAESGILRQTTELNLSELAAFLVDTGDGLPLEDSDYHVIHGSSALLDYVESYEAEPEDVWKEKILGKYNVK